LKEKEKEKVVAEEADKRINRNKEVIFEFYDSHSILV
jgi:hypothetical protein